MFSVELYLIKVCPAMLNVTVKNKKTKLIILPLLKVRIWAPHVQSNC
jgi:hypothetical protein